MQRNLQEPKEHLDLINMMTRRFASQGYQNVRADVPGMVTPDVIFGTKHNHMPDLQPRGHYVYIIDIKSWSLVLDFF